MGCSPWGCQESDTTERLPFHFSLSCIGEGNGNSLRCSCLENPRDSGAWWAAIYGVSQSRTRLKCLSSSCSSSPSLMCLFLTWRIFSITLLACEMSTIVWWFEHSLTLFFFGIGMQTDLFHLVATAEFSKFAGKLSSTL